MVSYSPLGRGMLTGTFTTRESVSGAGDLRATQYPQFSAENLDTNVKLVDNFRAIAQKKGCTPSQLALAWLLAQGGDIIPIPGTKRIKYLDENWGALDVHLTKEEVAEIRHYVEAAKLSGYRTVPMGLAMAYANTKEEES